MDLRVVLLIQDLFVIIFLSSRERSFPIQIRRWCRNCIGAFPLGLNPDGFPCFWFDFFGLQHHRDHDHDSPFSNLRKDFQTRNWDPGDSNYKTESGGLRQFTSHTYRSLFEFVLEICILVLSRSKTSLILCTDIGIFFHLMFLSFGIRELLLKFKTRDINLGFEDVMAFPLSDQFDAKTRKFVLPYSHLFVVVTNKKSFSEASDLSMRCALWSFNKEMFLTHTFRISGRPKMEKEIANSSGSTEKRIMDINEHQWVWRYRRHYPEPFQATYQSIRSIKVMRKAFRSFIYKMIACYECMKRGLNRFILLPVRLLLESRITSTSSSKLGFNFPFLFQWLYLNGFML